jgi:hypothetical protein
VVSEKKTVTVMARKAQKLRTMATKKIEKKIGQKRSPTFFMAKKEFDHFTTR